MYIRLSYHRTSITPEIQMTEIKKCLPMYYLPAITGAAATEQHAQNS